MAKKGKDKETPIVSLVEDPFGLNTLDIANAQKDSGELDLDEPFEGEPELTPELNEEDADTLQKLGKAISSSDQAHAESMVGSIVEGLTDVESAQELARQIAEDQALQKMLLKEAEEAEENDKELQDALPDANNLDQMEIQSCIEALLFMADKPISVEKLRDLLGPSFTPAIFQEAITELCDRYKNSHHGIELVKIAGGYQFRTKASRAPLARKLAKVQSQRLSSGAMESLAIVAYKQPVLKEDIDKIRGVDSSYFIRGLLDKKLIKIAGRSELPGRPMEYATTQEFLEVFGLAELSAMPALRELESMVPASQSEFEEDPRVKEMRKLVNQMTTDTSTTLSYDPKEDEKLLSEIRERVNSIPTSTPTLDAQNAAQNTAQKAAKEKAVELEVPNA